MRFRFTGEITFAKGNLPCDLTDLSQYIFLVYWVWKIWKREGLQLFLASVAGQITASEVMEKNEKKGIFRDIGRV